jgi:hypothetical protein
VTAWRALRRSAHALALAAALAAIPSACAERIGKRAAAGAVSGLQQQRSDDPQRQPARQAAANAVEGAVTALDEPEQRARIERLVSQAVSAAATSAVEHAAQQLVAELGTDGDGPLAVSFARTGERVSAAALGGVSSEIVALAPECAGPDPLSCLERRLQQTARATAASFSAGVRDTLGWQLLLVAFGVGVVGGVLGTWLWSIRHEQRRRSLRMA